MSFKPSLKQDEIAFKANLVSAAHDFCKLKSVQSSIINTKKDRKKTAFFTLTRCEAKLLYKTKDIVIESF